MLSERGLSASHCSDFFQRSNSIQTKFYRISELLETLKPSYESRTAPEKDFINQITKDMKDLASDYNRGFFRNNYPLSARFIRECLEIGIVDWYTEVKSVSDHSKYRDGTSSLDLQGKSYYYLRLRNGEEREFKFEIIRPRI